MEAGARAGRRDVWHVSDPWICVRNPVTLSLCVQGLGLSMSEALVFWRRAFQQRIPEDKFAKSYAYNIRYNYGQEGKRTDFSPYRYAWGRGGVGAWAELGSRLGLTPCRLSRSPCAFPHFLPAPHPSSCMKIIMNNPPSAGDHHGCPFRHFNPENLRAKLRCALAFATGTPFRARC